MNKNLKNQLKGLYIDIRIQCKNLMDDINEEKLIDIIHALYLISCEIKDIYNELEDCLSKTNNFNCWSFFMSVCSFFLN